jgi:hypothetical protein
VCGGYSAGTDGAHGGGGGHSTNRISTALHTARSTPVAPTAFAASEGNGLAGFLLHFAGGTFGGMAVRFSLPPLVSMSSA